MLKNSANIMTFRRGRVQYCNYLKVKRLKIMLQLKLELGVANLLYINTQLLLLHIA